MINRIHIQNVRSLKNVALDVDRMALLVGPNGSGKTTVLEAVRYCASSATSGVDSPKGPLHRNLHTWGVTVPAQVLLEGVISSKTTVPFTCSSSVPPTGVPDHLLQIDGKNIHPSKRTPEPESLRAAYSATKVYRLDPASIAGESGPVKGDSRIELDEAGRQVAALLVSLRVEAPQNEAIFQQGMREVFPNIRRFGFASGENGYRLTFDTVLHEGIPASAMGDGVLLVLTVLCAMAAPNGSHLILIDEIERGLHPKAQADFIDHLRKLLEQFPEKQLIATTHSPYLVDSFQPDEIHLFDLDEQGHTRTKKLSDHKDSERWKNAMEAGEFWSAVGEEWVTKGP